MIDINDLILTQVLYDSHAIDKINLFYKNNKKRTIHYNQLEELKYDDIKLLTSGKRYQNDINRECCYLFEHNIEKEVLYYYMGDNIQVNCAYLGIYDGDIYFLNPGKYSLVRNHKYDSSNTNIKFNYTKNNLKLIDEL